MSFVPFMSFLFEASGKPPLHRRDGRRSSGVASALRTNRAVHIPPWPARWPNRSAALIVALIVSAACADEERAADPAHPAVLAGRWIQVYPATGALDTLTLHDDGRVTGSTVGLGESSYPFVSWRIGADLMPGGFCIGEDKPTVYPNPQRYCQGYLLAGDTLWLANGQRTTFLRASGDGSGPILTPWTSPRGGVSAPTAGDSVARPPASVRER